MVQWNEVIAPSSIAIVIVVLRALLLVYLCVDGGNGINAILMPKKKRTGSEELHLDRSVATLSAP